MFELKPKKTFSISFLPKLFPRKPFKTKFKPKFSMKMFRYQKKKSFVFRFELKSVKTDQPHEKKNR